MAYGSRRMVSAVSQFFDDIGRARTMSNTYERLSRLSDAELDRRGLARDGLVHEAARRSGF